MNYKSSSAIIGWAAVAFLIGSMVGNDLFTSVGRLVKDIHSKTTVVTSVELETATTETWRNIVSKEATKPTMILVTGENCASCSQLENLLKQAAGKRPDVRFVKVDASVVNIQSADLPFSAFLFPKLGITASGNGFAPTTLVEVEQFLDARLVSAQNTLELTKSIEAANAKLEEALKPFEERAEKIKLSAAAATKALDDASAALNAKIEATGQPFEDQIVDLRAKKKAAVAGLLAERRKLRADIEEAMKPFNADFDKLEAESIAATADLDKVIKDLNASLSKLRGADSSSLRRN